MRLALQYPALLGKQLHELGIEALDAERLRYFPHSPEADITAMVVRARAAALRQFSHKWGPLCTTHSSAAARHSVHEGAVHDFRVGRHAAERIKVNFLRTKSGRVRSKSERLQKLI